MGKRGPSATLVVGRRRRRRYSRWGNGGQAQRELGCLFSGRIAPTVSQWCFPTATTLQPRARTLLTFFLFTSINRDMVTRCQPDYPNAPRRTRQNNQRPVDSVLNGICSIFYTQSHDMAFEIPVRPLHPLLPHAYTVPFSCAPGPQSVAQIGFQRRRRCRGIKRAATSYSSQRRLSRASRCPTCRRQARALFEITFHNWDNVSRCGF